MLTAILWYLAGVVTLPAIGLLLRKKEDDGGKETLKSQTWESINKIEYSSEFDHEFTQSFGSPDVAKLVHYGLKDFVSKQSERINFSVEPGKYSMKMDVFVRFIKRT